ncbi:Threonine/homoserine efflux transporter RhtA [Atopomonas hussainii]|uniref:Threonine/homoserine efflux transporter RhtA n=1 Tax=Atopomonas hussainii TaxID=1429083 RepID=A0A1H7QPY5_9GAMM|nr:DMT family transporter [Atopomonas hussainii]SEL49969.1 Threonine/homoserine efflux transporter RhtA [Atopomonas hussainii]
MHSFLIAAATILIWIGFMLVSRYGALSALSPWDMLALRLFPAALLLAPLWLWRGRTTLLQPRLLCLSAVGGLGYAGLVYQGFAQTSLAHAAVLLPGLLPFAIALLAWRLLAEPLGRARRQALLLMLLGLLCLGLETWQSPQLGLGDLYIVAATLCWALMTVLVRRWQVDLLTTMTALSLPPALLYAPLYFSVLGSDWHDLHQQQLLLQAGYQGVLAMLIAMPLYLSAVARLGAAGMGMLMGLIPPASAVAGIWLFAEAWQWSTVAALLLVLLGVARANAHLFTRQPSTTRETTHALHQH